MKTLLILLCGTILGYFMHKLYPADSLVHAAGAPPHTRLVDVPFQYGKPVPSYLYGPLASAAESRSKFSQPDPGKLTQKERIQFKGLFDLPEASFKYVADRLNQDELNRLITYGITQIRLHPKKAGRYANRLFVCHSLYSPVAEEPDPMPDASMDLPKDKSHQRTLAGSLVDYLPFSTIIPYQSLIDILSALLIALYYITTGLCCLLVAGFVGYHLLHLPWQQSVKITISPSLSDFYSAPNSVNDLTGQSEHIR